MDVNASHTTATRMYVKSFYSLTTKEPKKLCIPRNLGLHRWIPRAKCLCHDVTTNARLWQGTIFSMIFVHVYDQTENCSLFLTNRSLQNLLNLTATGNR